MSEMAMNTPPREAWREETVMEVFFYVTVFFFIQCLN